MHFFADAAKLQELCEIHHLRLHLRQFAFLVSYYLKEAFAIARNNDPAFAVFSQLEW